MATLFLAYDDDQGNHWVVSYDKSATPVTTVTLTVQGVTAGEVESDPRGIHCGGGCSATFVTGTRVTLTATADPDSTVAGWRSVQNAGACAGSSSPTCVLTLTQNTVVAASFPAIALDRTVAPLTGRWWRRSRTGRGGRGSGWGSSRQPPRPARAGTWTGST